MKTIVVVITHPEARPILEMNFPWLQRGGCDIAIIDHEGSKEIADVNSLFLHNIGGPPDSTKNRWVDRFLDVLRWCVSSPDTDGYTHYVLTEADSIFLKSVPELPDGIVATLAGHKSEGFLAKDYFHAPWIFSARAAEDFLRRARIMLDFNLSEHGFIDRFLGAYAELYGVPIQQMNTFSVNSVDTPEKLEAAKKVVATDCWFIHGIKSPSVLAQLTEGL